MNHDDLEDLYDDVNSEDSYNQRLDTEWTALSAIREMLQIALKGEKSPTYLQALEFGRQLSTSLFGAENSLIAQGRESTIITEYKQRADAESELEKRNVKPLEIIDREISEGERLLRAESEKGLIINRLNRLKSLRDHFIEKPYTENQLLIRDVFKADRDLPSPPIEKDTYREYQINADRGIRIRLLHPDPPEHSLGADLIYESYWESKGLVRFVLVQYKIWNGRELYFSKSGNLEKQLLKLKSAVCDAGFCGALPDDVKSKSYRLPFCAAFLRPTNKLQSPDSRFISKSLHLPLCAANRTVEKTKRGNKILNRKRFRSQSVSQKIFEEMFNVSMLGSRWITYSQIEELYKKYKILDGLDKVYIHAQEYNV